jgi:hypothetical protein
MKRPIPASAAKAMVAVSRKSLMKYSGINDVVVCSVSGRPRPHHIPDPRVFVRRCFPHLGCRKLCLLSQPLL